ncbi:MAG: twin-arginine translocation signal domain-containing protein, partial [Methylobacteriaceae bacterium]|nr:twin-arginine translocation signal domain-containing protein [Methylobacteriaceae bacterium]
MRGLEITRRDALRGTGAALTAAAATAAFPGGAFAQGAGPEVKGAKLGFIALTDAAPLL